MEGGGGEVGPTDLWSHGVPVGYSAAREHMRESPYVRQVTSETARTRPRCHLNTCLSVTQKGVATGTYRICVCVCVASPPLDCPHRGRRPLRAAAAAGWRHEHAREGDAGGGGGGADGRMGGGRIAARPGAC